MKELHKEWQNNGVEALLEYSNGTEYYKKFKNIKEAYKFIHNEGDHLEDFEIYTDYTKENN